MIVNIGKWYNKTYKEQLVFSFISIGLYTTPQNLIYKMPTHFNVREFSWTPNDW